MNNLDYHNLFAFYRAEKTASEAYKGVFHDPEQVVMELFFF